MNQNQLAWNYQYQQQRHVWRDVNRHVPTLPPDTRVLELGCGNGKTAAGILLQNVGQLFGVDFSPHAIQLCQERFKGEKRAFFQVADVTALPFEKESFDVVLCVHVLGSLLEKDRERVVKEILRVLNKRGLVYFEDFGKGDLRETKGKKIEKGTVERGNGLTYHYFTKPEIQTLFKPFHAQTIKRVIEKRKLGKMIVDRVEWQATLHKK